MLGRRQPCKPSREFSFTLKYNRRNNRLVPNKKRSVSRLYIVTLLVSLICRAHHEKRWAGRSTSFLRNINNLRYADDTTLMAESEEELKKPLDESERGE